MGTMGARDLLFITMSHNVSFVGTSTEEVNASRNISIHREQLQTAGGEEAGGVKDPKEHKSQRGFHDL
ncbi:hypothetical protein EYF80_026290 [Liparis tanakae]|uniref:Uncharacterized protein n=1 Tax=Liparis tanakae TaxID=230148 RepID=A0A4Z2HD56_9TELE|nr:hypothetical protein EYF80_026290 [Liparis tanakae]